MNLAISLRVCIGLPDKLSDLRDLLDLLDLPDLADLLDLRRSLSLSEPDPESESRLFLVGRDEVFDVERLLPPQSESLSDPDVALALALDLDLLGAGLRSTSLSLPLPLSLSTTCFLLGMVKAS
jgi:hypothetical protein